MRDKTVNKPHSNEILTFGATAYNKPMKYLKKLLEYFNSANITQRMFKHVVRQSLRGPASNWWESVQDHVQTIADFKNRFTERNWCRQTQA